MSNVVVSLHDVAPSTEAESRTMLELVERRRLSATLLVVPGPWGGHSLDSSPEFGRWLRDVADRGHEISLHGWCHDTIAIPDPAVGFRVRNRVLARGCGEFGSLSYAAARRRLELGVASMDAVGLRPVGFTPPGWLASSAALDALYDLGFAYSTSHLGVHDLWHDVDIGIPAISQRPESRLSGVGAAAVRRYAVRRIANGSDVRIAIHPRDLHDTTLRATTECLLDVATCAHTTTYAEFVGALPAMTGIG